MKNKKKILIIVVLLLVFFTIRQIVIYPYLHLEYAGKVTKYKFDIKGYSKFQLDDKNVWYEMHYLNCDLMLGDSMVKNMDSRYIYQYRDGILKEKYGAILGQKFR